MANENENNQRRYLPSAHNWRSWSAPPFTRPPISSIVVPIPPGAEPPSGKGPLHQVEPPARTAAESMVDLLCQLGLDTFFGLPGGPIIPIFDAILTNPRARLIEPRQETYGAFAAAGYYRSSGRVPVVVVTAGPGATNVITGVVSAHLERVPLLLICGDVPALSTGKRMLQDTSIDGVGIERMLAGVSRLVVRIAHAQSASAQVCAAVQAATDPRCPGPAVVVLSIDKAGSKGRAPCISAPACADLSPARVKGPIGAGPGPDKNLLDTVARHLASARRPLLIVGAGCRLDQAPVQALVEAAGVPFVTTPQAKGLIAEDHPLSLRTCGMGSSMWARSYMNSGADVTLALGTDLDDVAICATPPVAPGGTLIHVDLDARVFARNVPTAIGATYDVGVFAAALSPVLLGRGAPDRADLLREAKSGPAFDVDYFGDDLSLPLSPYRAVSDLWRAAGPRTTFITDIGEHMLFALHYLTIRQDQRFVIHLGLGSMGSGISSAIGHALGDPGRRVVCICGDGGMQMAGMEILLAIKYRLPIVYAVFNDGRYNMVYQGYKLHFGREAAWDMPTIDFVTWAQALGARGRRIERPGEIDSALLTELTADGGPVVLDIRHNPELRVRSGGRAEAIMEMTGK